MFFKICDWKNFYGNLKEAILADAPPARGKEVKIRMFVDSDHAGDKLMMSLHMGFIIYVNMAPIIWVSKKQPTIKI